MHNGILTAAVTLALIAVAVPAPGLINLPDEGCVLEDNIEPQFICYRLVKEESVTLSFAFTPTASTNTTVEIATVAVVAIEPLQLGPFPAIGVGVAGNDACQLYDGFGDCEVTGPGTTVYQVELGAGNQCLYRTLIQFRPWQGGPDPSPPWTTIGFFLTSGDCPDPPEDP